MGKIFFLSIYIFTVMLFLGLGITKTPAFAGSYEGIKLRQFDDGTQPSCLYKDENSSDSLNDVVKNVTKENGYVFTIDCVPILFMNLVFWALSFAGLVALLFVIYGGFKFMTSGGDQKGVEGARKTITWAVIGLVVVLLSFAIVHLVADVTGFTCLTKFGFIGTCGGP